MSPITFSENLYRQHLQRDSYLIVDEKGCITTSEKKPTFTEKVKRYFLCQQDSNLLAVSERLIEIDRQIALLSGECARELAKDIILNKRNLRILHSNLLTIDSILKKANRKIDVKRNSTSLIVKITNFFCSFYGCGNTLKPYQISNITRNIFEFMPLYSFTEALLGLGILSPKQEAAQEELLAKLRSLGINIS